MTEQRPPLLPPFDLPGAVAKVQAAEDAWNSRDPHKVSLAYTQDSIWRNRDTFITGRDAIVEFLTAKWERELDYVLRKSLWAFHDNRIAVRFQYESHDHTGQWFRSYGNELWEFDNNGLMRRREASINDVAINESDRRWHGIRPEAERGVDYWTNHDMPLQRHHSSNGIDRRTTELARRSHRRRSPRLHPRPRTSPPTERQSAGRTPQPHPWPATALSCHNLGPHDVRPSAACGLAVRGRRFTDMPMSGWLSVQCGACATLVAT